MMWGITSKGIVMLPHLTSAILSELEGVKVPPLGDPIENMRKARERARERAEGVRLLRSN